MACCAAAASSSSRFYDKGIFFQDDTDCRLRENDATCRGLSLEIGSSEAEPDDPVEDRSRVELEASRDETVLLTIMQTLGAWLKVFVDLSLRPWSCSSKESLMEAHSEWLLPIQHSIIDTSLTHHS
jgi:hypothetical protein